MSKKKFAVNLFVLFHVLFGTPLFAQNSPTLLCNSVEPNGDVTITWASPVSPPGACFSGYEIFFSYLFNGPYSSLATIPSFNQNSFLHAGALASDKKIFYYIKALSTCNGGSLSDTLSTILLSTNRNGPVTDLSWNSFDPVNSPLNNYNVYREFKLGSGNWSKITSTTNLNYSDTIIYCSNPRYKVETNNGTCIITSSVEEGFDDITGPGITEITTVTVNVLTGKVNITWPVNPAKDTKGYYILTYKDATSDPITLDTVYGRNSTFYADQVSDPSTGSKAYVLMPFDSCGKFTRFGLLKHQTIFLSVTNNICNGSATLTWNKYLNWPGGVKNYEIYVNSILVATVDSNSTSYVHTGLSQSTTYDYYIKAIPVLATINPSFSNKKSITTGNVIAPMFVDIKLVTVAGMNRVNVIGSVDSLADVSAYRLTRSLSASGPYKKIEEIPKTSVGTISFTDNSALTQESSYFYKIEVIDNCGAVALTSNIGRTIYISVVAEDDFLNSMTWNEYSTSDSSYMIYRSIDGLWDSNPIKVNSVGSVNYLDDVSTYTDGRGEFCYKVQAVINYKKNYPDTSTSNEFCITQSPRLFVPNAFVPKGENPKFYPVNVYPEVKSYIFTIYNRWGNKIFETSDPRQAWDGTSGGSKSPQDVYVYFVHFTGTSGKTLERKGIVTLIR